MPQGFKIRSNLVVSLNFIKTNEVGFNSRNFVINRKLFWYSKSNKFGLKRAKS